MLRSFIPGRGLACLAVAILVALSVPATALGHAELERSSPADGATVESPFDGPIAMTFSAALADGSKADLVGPDGAVIASATVDGATMTIALEAALAPADYEVKWVSVADDGDLLRDTLSFAVAPAPPTPSPTEAPTPTASPSAPATSTPEATLPASPEPSPVPTASPDPGATSSTGDVILPIVVGLLVIGVGAVYLLGRRNRPTLP